MCHNPPPLLPANNPMAVTAATSAESSACQFPRLIATAHSSEWARVVLRLRMTILRLREAGPDRAYLGVKGQI